MPFDNINLSKKDRQNKESKGIILQNKENEKKEISDRKERKEKEEKMKRTCLISLVAVLLVSLFLIGCEPGSASTPTPPAAPTGLSCEAISNSEIKLSWNFSTGLDSYYIYRCTGTGCTPTTLVHTVYVARALPLSNIFWSDTGLSPSTTYRYRMKAHNGAGESGYGAITSCTTKR